MDLSRTSTKSTLSRRHFLKTTALAGTALVVEINLAGCAAPARRQPEIPPDWEPNAWLTIDHQNVITFALDKSEMGQGVMTGLTTLIAEELNVEPTSIRVESARAAKVYANPAYGVQLTGGSTSVAAMHAPLRKAAASVRTAMVNAAADRWGIRPAMVTCRDGMLSGDNRSARFADLLHAVARAELPDDSEIRLKPASAYRFIGKPGLRLDGRMKAMGTGTFGIDVQEQGTLKAALKRCPVPGGKLVSWTDKGAARRPGVRKVVEIETGVAVLADNWWQAQQALSLIEIEWDHGGMAGFSTEEMFREFAHAARNTAGKEVRKDGRGNAVLEDAARVVDIEYRAPYLAHVTMEPMNCTVALYDDRCEIWVPTQGPAVVAAWAEHLTGLPRDRVHVNTTLLGGGFGRRLTQDYAIEAIRIAQVSGEKVQLIWSRQDDIQHDAFRPAALARFRAGFDARGRLLGVSGTVVTPSIMATALGHLAGAVLPASFPNWMSGAVGSLGPLYGNTLLDPSCVEGAADTPYDFGNLELSHVAPAPGVPVGYWRSVGHSFNAFFMESLMDELAGESGQDPLNFRLSLLSGEPRMANVLREVARLGGWGKPAPGRFQGLAVHASFKSFVAQLAEISINNGAITVHKVTCVADCGQIINPDIVTAQMEGGIVFGLSAALQGEIVFKDGRVQQSNFHDYAPLRHHQVPEIAVHLITSSASPGGVGEPGVPPIAPAVANAVFAATGKRLRQLPLRLNA